jgi:hypothetical protein
LESSRNDIIEAGRNTWTAAIVMVEKLLSLRIDDFREEFGKNKSTAQRKVLWGKLAFQFNMEMPLEFPVASLQQKYQKLKADFSKGMAELDKTGNEGIIEENLPPHCDILLDDKLGNKSGLGV